MPNSNQLFRLLNEMVFMLVGALLLWVGLFGRYLFNARGVGWLVVTAAVIFWGLRTWFQASGVRGRGERAATRIAGGSLAIVGILLLSLGWAPFRLAGLLLAAAGGIFVLRGLITAVIMARS
jgi:hypothetical protein